MMRPSPLPVAELCQPLVEEGGRFLEVHALFCDVGYSDDVFRRFYQRVGVPGRYLELCLDVLGKDHLVILRFALLLLGVPHHVV